MGDALKRTFDPSPFNEIANDPAVRPWLGGEGDFNATADVFNKDNFAFLTDCRQGGYIYRKIGIGLYEVHTLALPAARGRPMLRAMWEGLAAVFLGSDAVEVVTLVPDNNKGADIWAEHAGFREMHRRDNAWMPGVGISFRSLSYADWVLKDPDNAEAGRRFHDEIHHHTTDDHGEDPVHDAWVGATMRGIREGNVGKCVALYNRYAALARYHPVAVISTSPPVLDIGSAIVQVTAERGMEILHVPTARSVSSTADKIEEDASCLLQQRSAQPPPSAAPP